MKPPNRRGKYRWDKYVKWSLSAICCRTTTNVLHNLYLFVDNSAKVAEGNEITPQSNYVRVYENGSCNWAPRYELSITHCGVDVTWFPFDEQVCNVTFESWYLSNFSLNLFTRDESIELNNFLPPEGWRLTGTLCRSTEMQHLKIT